MGYSIPRQLLQLLQVHYAGLEHLLVVLFALFGGIVFEVGVGGCSADLLLFIEDVDDVQLFGNIVVSLFSDYRVLTF